VSFEAPELLVGLLLVPIAAVGYWLLQRRPPKFAVRYTNLDVLAGVAGRRRAWKRHVPAALLLASLAALAIAFARPTITVQAPNERASVVLVVDTSGSMRATDVKPSRLDAAKRAMRAFLDHAPDTLRVGVVSFSDEPQVVVSPTIDRKMLAQGIDVLGPGFGTAIGDALARAVVLARSATGATETGGGNARALRAARWPRSCCSPTARRPAAS
jgi:Ca-activated chloride channel family protein